MTKTTKFEREVAEMVADAREAECCCPFHARGGHISYACGGDVPNSRGRHSPSCSSQFGGDCTCGTDQGEF